jgi:hypothetical protein
MKLKEYKIVQLHSREADKICAKINEVAQTGWELKDINADLMFLIFERDGK